MFKIIKLLSINFLVFLFLLIIGVVILEIISSNSEKQTDQKGTLIFDYSLGWDSYPPIEEIGKKKHLIKKNYVYWRFFYSQWKMDP